MRQLTRIAYFCNTLNHDLLAIYVFASNRRINVAPNGSCPSTQMGKESSPEDVTLSAIPQFAKFV